MGSAPRFTNEAIEVIEQRAADKRDLRPLMLYLAYPAPHTPWLPSTPFVGKSGAGMYGDFLMMVDSEIGRVLAAPRKAGMARNTLLIFTSDNGPVWYEADVERLGHDSSGGLRGMKSDNWKPVTACQGHADTNFSILRRTALSLLKNETTAGVGIENKRLTAAWDESYLEKVLLAK